MNREKAIEQLKEHMKPGDTIWTELKHVSRSGMTRYITVRLLKPHTYTGECYPYDWTYVASVALGWSFNDKHRAIKVGGCGMDMGFHLVYSLGQVLWPDGTPEPHGVRNGEPDSCGGYALNHRWL